MRLDAYLQTEKLRPHELAASLNVRTQTVYKWLNGTRRPSDAMKVKIVKVTNGAVGYDDLVLALNGHEIDGR